MARTEKSLTRAFERDEEGDARRARLDSLTPDGWKPEHDFLAERAVKDYRRGRLRPPSRSQVEAPLREIARAAAALHDALAGLAPRVVDNDPDARLSSGWPAPNEAGPRLLYRLRRDPIAYRLAIDAGPLLALAAAAEESVPPKRYPDAWARQEVVYALARLWEGAGGSLGVGGHFSEWVATLTGEEGWEHSVRVVLST